MSVVEVRCKGAFGFIWLPHAFTFRVYPDGGLLVSVEWLSEPQLSPTFGSLQECENQELLEVDDSSIFYATCERAQRVPGAEELVYDVEFTVVRWNGVRSMMKCSGRLSSARGLEGHYSQLQVNGTETSTPFSLSSASRQPRKIPLVKQCFPLTPGSYDLRGYVYGTERNITYYMLEMQLLEDGQLIGTARDASFPFEDKLTGAWTRDKMQCVLEYQEEDGSMSSDSYSCTPTLAGLRGSWQRIATDRLSDTPDDDPDMHGWFEFLLVKSQRKWRPSVHCDFPQQFQQITKLLLLTSHRAPTRSAYALPTALWQHVLSYCDFNWFGYDSDEVSARKYGN